MDILITAGATRNPIDAMRYISANSSGQTGAWLAEQLMDHGAVHFMGSPEAQLRCRSDCKRSLYGSTADLLDKMKQWIEAHPESIVVHAAAVGDYAVQEAQTGEKIASGQRTVSLNLVPTPKIIDRIHEWAPRAQLFSFKAAAPGTDAPTLTELARSQRERTRSHTVFANVIGSIDRQVLVLGPDGPQWFASRPLGMAALVAAIQNIS